MDRRKWLGGLTYLVLTIAGCELQGIDSGSGAATPAGTASPLANGGEVQCYFSPHGGCTDAVVQELSNARTTISVQAYSFTSAAIAKALETAHQRGVKVQVILDKSQRTEQYSSADFLVHAGIKTYVDSEHAIAHNKIILIDGQTLITGSFNFTKQAETSNAENLLVIRQAPELYAQYQHNFDTHLQHSEPYAGRGMDTSSPPNHESPRRVTERKHLPPHSEPSRFESTEEPPVIQNSQGDSPVRAQ